MQTGKIYFYISFLYIKELTRYYQKKTKKGFQKRLVKGTKIFLKKKKKTKSVKMLMSYIEEIEKKRQ